jgi:tetratricopeptide (TPR) repeat protein
VSSSYWWYPSSTYCPTYLYVPSTVVVVDDGYYGGGTTEVIVDSGARERAPAPDAEVAGMTASLAAKYVELGDYYFKAGRFTDAVGAYGKARSYAPDDASLHFVLADAVFADGDYLYAAFLIGEGLRMDPGLASASTDKRAFYGDASAFDAQMKALDRHLERRPDDALAHLLRGYNLRFSGRSVDAVVAFRRVLELDPANRSARTFLDAIEKPAAAEPLPR